MVDPERFHRAMLRALDEWPKSCEVAMTTPGLNRRAWIGHAGTYLATSSPEETTRLGWLDPQENYRPEEPAYWTLKLNLRLMDCPPETPLRVPDHIPLGEN